MVKQAKKVKKRNPLLPVFGLILAIIFVLFAAVLVPPVADFLRSRNVDFGTLGVDVQNLIIGGMIWFIMFGTAMFFVAILVGRNPGEKENIEFMKHAAKRRKQRERERKQRR